MNMKRVIQLMAILILFIPMVVKAAPASGSGTVKIPDGPKFWISDVTRNESVKLSFANYPKGKVYYVYMSHVGGRLREYKVGMLKKTSPKDFRKSFPIPKELKKELHIAIMVINLEDNTHGYTIFENSTGFDVHTPWSLTPIHRSSAQTPGKSVAIFDGPTFWIKDLVRPDQLTIKFTNYNRVDRYSVTIGENNANFQGLFLGAIDPPDGKTHTRTYKIPASLWPADELKVMVSNVVNGHTGSTAFTNKINWKVIAPYGNFTTYYTSSGVSSTATPFTNILNVVKDSEVTLQTFNFPANKDFLVTMGPMGTKGIGGFVVGTQNTGTGGSFVVTYPIPAQLWGSEFIAIRLESTSSTHFAYDFFENADGYSAAVGTTSAFSGDWLLPAGTHPYTQVSSVNKDTSVTINGTNFTKNDTYTVYMGPMGTKGVGGWYVGDKLTGNTSAFTATFNIPAALQGSSMIAIRFESHNTTYYAYDWFYNSDYP
jgi:hypothetical protein